MESPKMSKAPKASEPTTDQTIPWHEILTRHVSIIEGHMRMLNLVQKRAAAGSDESNVVEQMIKRGKMMLKQSQLVNQSIPHEKPRAGEAGYDNGDETSSTGGTHKRTLEEPAQTQSGDAPSAKKQKVKEGSAAYLPEEIGELDITAEVDARMKRREEWRKNKGKTAGKRKRDSEPSAAEPAAQAMEAEKNKPKKAKKAHSTDGEETQEVKFAPSQSQGDVRKENEHVKSKDESKTKGEDSKSEDQSRPKAIATGTKKPKKREEKTQAGNIEKVDQEVPKTKDTIKESPKPTGDTISPSKKRSLEPEPAAAGAKKAKKRHEKMKAANTGKVDQATAKTEAANHDEHKPKESNTKSKKKRQLDPEIAVNHDNLPAPATAENGVAGGTTNKKRKKRQAPEEAAARATSSTP